MLPRWLARFQMRIMRPMIGRMDKWEVKIAAMPETHKSVPDSPTRFEIMKYLLTHPACITGDIVAFLPLAQATVSQHLRVLREAGWITGENEGPATCYYLNDENIAWFREKVGEIF